MYYSSSSSLTLFSCVFLSHQNRHLVGNFGSCLLRHGGGWLKWRWGLFSSYVERTHTLRSREVCFLFSLSSTRRRRLWKNSGFIIDRHLCKESGRHAYRVICCSGIRRIFVRKGTRKGADDFLKL